MGLREQIKQAKTETEVTELVSKGKSYEWASDQTKRSWKSTAKFRIAELTNPVPSQTPDKSVVAKKTKKVKK